MRKIIQGDCRAVLVTLPDRVPHASKGSGPLKLCGLCGGMKPASEFYRRRASADGRQSYCKRCAKAWWAARRAATRPKAPAGTACRAPTEEGVCSAMPAWLRHLRALALLERVAGGGGFGDEVCPLCGATGAANRNGNGERMPDIVKRCALCRGFGSVPKGVAAWYVGARWLADPGAYQPLCGRMANRVVYGRTAELEGLTHSLHLGIPA